MGSASDLNITDCALISAANRQSFKDSTSGAASAHFRSQDHTSSKKHLALAPLGLLGSVSVDL